MRWWASHWLRILVCPYQYECNQLLLMACSCDNILLCKNKLPKLDRCSLTIIERFNRTEHQIPWQDHFIISLGFINKVQFFTFTQYQLFLYSVDSLAKLHSFSLFKNNYTSSISGQLQYCLAGTVYDQRAFYIHFNGQSHRVLSVVDCETWDPIRHFNLTEMFPDVQQFVYMAMTDDSIQFPIELNDSQYAVQVCSLDRSLSMQGERQIRLSYADKPSRICSVYFPNCRKRLLVINDPSAKVIHLLSREKYLQSYPLIAHALCYVGDNHELVLASDVDIGSISLHANDLLFSKLSWKRHTCETTCFTVVKINPGLIFPSTCLLLRYTPCQNHRRLRWQRGVDWIERDSRFNSIFVSGEWSRSKGGLRSKDTGLDFPTWGNFIKMSQVWAIGRNCSELWLKLIMKRWELVRGFYSIVGISSRSKRRKITEMFTGCNRFITRTVFHTLYHGGNETASMCTRLTTLSLSLSLSLFACDVSIYWLTSVSDRSERRHS